MVISLQPLRSPRIEFLKPLVVYNLVIPVMTFPSTVLGRYEVRSQLGAGGMGEVYLAWDTELERTVALKMLPADFASDQRRMRRFVQEARAASALNHPNILTIYEIGETDSTRFIATEFIDGETIRQCMTSAKLKLNELLDVILQVAGALAAAHEAGIIHRDIKPLTQKARGSFTRRWTGALPPPR
jgi:hypothetical protein